MGLATRDQVHLSCPDWGQSPQSRDNGPHRQCIYNGHVNQGSPLPEIEHIHRGFDHLVRCSGGMHHCHS
jgi:hypothetical protein